MENKELARKIKLLGQLMELHGENPFKTKAFLSAAQTLSKYPISVAQLPADELAKIPGIGKSIAAKLAELIHSGQIEELNTLLEQTPAGVLQMLMIKGIGPKKTATIWKELGIDNLEQLWTACDTNLLAKAKGFGAKTQLEIKDIVEFSIENEGKYRYADAEPVMYALLTSLKDIAAPALLYSITGEMRRACEVVKTIDVLIGAPADDVKSLAERIPSLKEISIDGSNDCIEARFENGFPIRLFYTEAGDFYAKLIATTGSTKHLEVLNTYFPQGIPSADNEAAVYQKADMAWIPPEIREGNREVQLAKTHQLPSLISETDIRGCLHNHSTWSDGVFSVREMASYCKDVLGLQYFGIADHSKTAGYAHGLSIDRVQQQWAEINALNESLAPFRIFKGIESDILVNGDLDYPTEILSQFDYVVSSIHAPLNMDEKKATARLIKAIENPFTTILGHPTARQLLIRRGYAIDYKKVIDACAANGVVMEINSNPYRLDIDWRWIDYCLEKGVTLSINPDAHHTAELHFMRYGVLMGRKGGLEAKDCLNCLSLNEIETYFNNRKAAIHL